MSWSLLALLALAAVVGCSKVEAVNPPSPSPSPGPAAPAAEATLASLRAMIEAAPAGLRVVHELVAPRAEGAPRAGSLAWVTTLPVMMELQVAASGPVSVTLDGARVFEATAPAVGALVPAKPLAVGRGELVIHVERGPVEFVRARELSGRRVREGDPRREPADGASALTPVGAPGAPQSQAMTSPRTRGAESREKGRDRGASPSRLAVRPRCDSRLVLRYSTWR